MNENMEKEAFVINNDSLAEWALTKIKEEEAERDRLIAVATEKIDFYKTAIEDAQRRCDNETAYLKGLLMSYFGTVPHKETKTQETYRLPSGQLIGKKAKLDYSVNDEALLAYLKENKPEYIKVTEKPAWAEFKKTLTIMDGKAIDTETGEAVGGIDIIEKPESFEIKFS